MWIPLSAGMFLLQHYFAAQQQRGGLKHKASVEKLLLKECDHQVLPAPWQHLLLTPLLVFPCPMESLAL